MLKQISSRCDFAFIMVCLITMMSVLIPKSVSAQNLRRTPPAIKVELMNPRIEAGQSSQLLVTVSGGPAESIPKKINVPGLTIELIREPIGDYYDKDLPNGDRIRVYETLYRYRVSGSIPGDYRIPAIRTNVGGQPVLSESKMVRITPIRPPVTPKGPRFSELKLGNEKQGIYVNEIFALDAFIYVQGMNSMTEVIQAELNHEAFSNIRFERVDFSSAELGNSVYSRAKLPAQLFCLKPGAHSLGPAEFRVKLYEPKKNFPFVKNYVTRPVESDTLDIKILPFPEPSPKSFTGGVGTFEMSYTAKPLDVKVGDPISVDFVINGTGNLVTMQAPLLFAQDETSWKAYDAKKSITKESDGIDPGQVKFSQVIIPLKEVAQLPRFELSFFNPKTAKYETEETTPLSLRVTPDKSFSAGILGSGGDANPATAVNSVPFVKGPPIPRFDDILHIRKKQPRWRRYTAEASPPVLLYIANALLGSAFFGLLGWGLLQKWRSFRAAAKLQEEEVTLTFKDACQKVRAGMARDDFFHCALEAFRLWEDENPDAKEEVKKLAADLRRKCETALYSAEGDHSQKKITTSEANEYIKVLRKLPS